MSNQCCKSWAASRVSWCWAWEMSPWCRMSMGPAPPMDADGSIICPSAPAFPPPKHSSIYSDGDSTKEQPPQSITEGKVKVICLSKADQRQEPACARTHAHTQAFLCWFVWMCVKLLNSWVGKKTLCKFTQSPPSFSFKAWGLAEYTTAGGTVKGQGSKWLSLPRLTCVWPWQANPNMEEKTYVKTICRRRKGRMWGPCQSSSGYWHNSAEGDLSKYAHP